jgi:hypothetical protein
MEVSLYAFVPMVAETDFFASDTTDFADRGDCFVSPNISHSGDFIIIYKMV